MITFPCTCGRTLAAKPQAAGKLVRCPACGQTARVPDVPAESTEQPVPAEHTPTRPTQGHAEQPGEGAEGAGLPAQCPRCGAALAPAAVICTACGVDLRTGTKLPPPLLGSPEAPPPTPIERQMVLPVGTLLKLLAALLVLALPSLCIWWLVNRASRDAEPRGAEGTVTVNVHTTITIGLDVDSETRIIPGGSSRRLFLYPGSHTVHYSCDDDRRGRITKGEVIQLRGPEEWFFTYDYGGDTSRGRQLGWGRVSMPGPARTR